MASPGFTGGGASEYFGGAGGYSGRSMAATAMNNPTTGINGNLHPSRPLYRTQKQLPAIFLDPSSQIARQTPSLIGKRTLAEFQNQQSHNHPLSNLLLRSVKPRTFQHNSPMSPLSPMDFSMSPELPNSSGLSTQRFGMPFLQQLRPQPQPINPPLLNGNLPMSNCNSILPNTSLPYTNSSTLGHVQNRVCPVQEPEKKFIDHQLQELEKQLLEDNDEEEGDTVSVITNSEWSDTIQNLNLIAPGQKPISSSPTTSTTSSTSSSSSVASPASGCSRQSIMEAASAISEGKTEAASEILARLSQFSNPKGNSDQRLTDCMVSALKSRLNPLEHPPPIAELFSMEHADSIQMLYNTAPCFKVGFMAANLAILEAALEDATENGTKLHVVDFDVGRGNQYVNLLHVLSSCQNGKPATVKITAVAENGSEERLKLVGDNLKQRAGQYGIGLEFNVLTQKLADLTRESLGCDPDEPLLVNFAFKMYRMADESVSTENPRDELLRFVKGLAPRVVTLVEQEMNINTAPFMARVTESCSYYGALFDSIESITPRDNSDRVKAEEGLSRKLGNVIACEGRERVERCEVFGKWRARMSMAGFQLKPMSQIIAESIRARLNSGNVVNPGSPSKRRTVGFASVGWVELSPSHLLGVNFTLFYFLLYFFGIIIYQNCYYIF
ncbi:hypothetical protein L6164_008379 [Bauhinia variegata]|uniref:Uncharacterized protein n=1 Tax=Bauhinia variegata TaxID=167791 RepID=A0ACB9PFJ6_BAUVA|nr:hypothetical protein L6164_008379 [Bauhinia variegata]